MIPMRTSTVFKSRWMALVWAAGILWTAYDYAEAQPQPAANAAAANNASDDEPTDATGAPITPEDQQKLADAINTM
jgi:hypothetical protein